MTTMTEAQLRDGVIYGDHNTSKYVYMPASEIGAEHPLCVSEYQNDRQDVNMQEAMDIIRLRSLKPVKHPLLGWTSC